jgi:hypothetical protein
MKVVVFDLDETLGYFVEFGIFWDGLQQYFTNHKINYSLTQEDFNIILDLYPEFLRPNILTLLKYLMYKKKSKCCQKMLIYTNNQGPNDWCKQLIAYFENKINYKLFDQIINAFKINGEVIEFCRTTHDKSFHDLVKCTKIPPNSQICFLDDHYYPEMANDNVYYINVKPYIHDLDFNEMIKRFWNSSVREKIFSETGNNKTMNEVKKIFEKNMNYLFEQYGYMVFEKTKEENNIDKIVSKQVLIHLQEFFDQTPSESKSSKYSKSLKRGKNRNNRNNGTRKRFHQ